MPTVIHFWVARAKGDNSVGVSVCDTVGLNGCTDLGAFVFLFESRFSTGGS